jgi:hypothetical protein
MPIEVIPTRELPGATIQGLMATRFSPASSASTIGVAIRALVRRCASTSSI